ncbi:MAG: hypothetical protein ACK47B_01230 [Armatimonadota bacterium]
MVALTQETEARLRRKAAREGRSVDELAEALIAAALNAEPEIPSPHEEPDSPDRPFRRDPLLMGIQFHEDPTAPISPSDWPEAFE